MSRCLRLPYFTGPPRANETQEKSSWYKFVVETFKGRNHYSRNRKVLASIIVAMSSLFIAIFIFDHMTGDVIDKSRAISLCVAGERDIAMGLIQYSKLVLEFLSVTIYAIGPNEPLWTSPGQPHFTLRHGALALFMYLSWILALVCIFTGLHRPTGHSMFIPRILDQDISTPMVEIAHINAISLLGLLERWRSLFGGRCRSRSGAL